MIVDSGGAGSGKRGRKPGSRNKLTHEIKTKLIESGEHPHLFLLKIVNAQPIIEKYIMGKDQDGNPIYGDREWYATMTERMDVAVKLAPYFAPKLVSSSVTVENDPASIADAIDKLSRKLPD